MDAVPVRGRPRERTFISRLGLPAELGLEGAIVAVKDARVACCGVDRERVEFRCNRADAHPCLRT